MTDYISREAELEVINGIDSYFSKYIEAIPAADVEERKTGEWLHDLLQDAIDAGIITETQAVRIMERAKE